MGSLQIIDIGQFNNNDIENKKDEIKKRFTSEHYVGSASGIPVRDGAEKDMINMLFNNPVLSFRNFSGNYRSAGAFDLLCALNSYSGDTVTLHSSIKNSHFFIKVKCY